MTMDERLIVELLFHCMACDGEIAHSEQEVLYKICLMETELRTEEIESYIQELVKALTERRGTLDVFLKKLAGVHLEEAQQVFLLESLIQMILADGVLQHEEVAYFNRVCQALSVPRELVRDNFPDYEDWLDMEASLSDEWSSETLYIESFQPR